MRPIVGVYGVADPSGAALPAWTHDHGVAVLRGRRVDVLQLERLTRVRHDNRLDAHLGAALELLGVSSSDCPRFALADACVGGGFRDADGVLVVEDAAPGSLVDAPIPVRGTFWAGGAEAWQVPHELAHVGAAWPYCGGFRADDLLVHVDGRASRSSASVWQWRSGRFVLLDATYVLDDAVNDFATSHLAQRLVGHTWREFLSVPGKLMGLAAWGHSSPELRAWLAAHDWFRDLRGDPDVLDRAVRARWGEAASLAPSGALGRDIAATIQARFSDEVSAYVLGWQQRTGARRLVLSGGAALNIVTNVELALQGSFVDVCVPPCCGDDGLALGAAVVLALHLGEEVSQQEAWLQGWGDVPVGAPPCAADVARRLAEGEVVATCIGPAEVGPRSLGARSLLAAPSVAGRDLVSLRLKGRESYRPVAPLVHPERVAELAPDALRAPTLARWMLGAFDVAPTWATEVPGVVHADGTARVQVVDGESPVAAWHRDLLDALWTRHGIPCCINTSFNQRGEPLVHTVARARELAKAWGIHLALGS